MKLKLKNLISEATLDDLVGGSSDPSGQGQTPPEATGDDPKDVQNLIDRFSTNQQMKMAVKRINQPVEIVPAIMAFIHLINKESGAAGKMTKAHLARIRNQINKLEL